MQIVIEISEEDKKEVLALLDHKDLNELEYFKGISPSSEVIARFIYKKLKEKFYTITKVSVANYLLLRTRARLCSSAISLRTISVWRRPAGIWPASTPTPPIASTSLSAQSVAITLRARPSVASSSWRQVSTPH